MDNAMIDQCIGRMADIIYLDSRGTLSQYRVHLYSVRDGKARVFDVSKRGFRTLAANRIIAAVPMKEHIA